MRIAGLAQRLRRVPGSVGVPTRQVCQQSTGLCEHDRVPAATGLMTEALSNHRLADPNGPVDYDRLPGFDKAERGEVAYLGGRNFLVVLEVEVLQGTGLLEASLGDAPLDAGSPRRAISSSQRTWRNST